MPRNALLRLCLSMLILGAFACWESPGGLIKFTDVSIQIERDPGTGSGRVFTSSLPEGDIDCTLTVGSVSGICFERFDDGGGGGTFTIAAAAAPGSVFAGWRASPASPKCSGTATLCELIFVRDQEKVDFTVWASFNLPEHTLDVTGAGTGNGRVVSSPTRIDCTITAGVAAGSCSAAFTENRSVTLTPTAPVGSAFTLWTADCVGAGNCALTMTADKATTAQFDLMPPRTLDVTLEGTGSGSVVSDPAGIDCTITLGVASGSCTAEFAFNTNVTLTPTAAAGSTGLPGDCNIVIGCRVRMNEDRAVTVRFDLGAQPRLTLTGAGTGNGGVVSAPAGINCTITAGTAAGACAAVFPPGTNVMLTPTAAAGSVFVVWTGDCAGAGNCAVTMTADKAATAQFDFGPQRTLTVAGAGTGNGSVVSSPAGINCTITAGVAAGACAAPFADDAGVTLTPTPAGGSAFTVWTGDCAGAGDCALTMTADKAATAQFDLLPFTAVIAFDHDEVFGNVKRDIFVMNADGMGLIQITADAADDEEPSWTGTKIAFQSERTGDQEIYLMNQDGSGVERLTTSVGRDSDPALSPDGTKIAFQSERDGDSEIFVMDVDGTGLTQLTKNASGDFQPAWSADGTKIVFYNDGDGDDEIFVMNADGMGLTRLTTNGSDDFTPVFSPDGTKIAFVSDRTGNDEIFVMNADGSTQVNLTTDAADDSDPDWSPDGTLIVFNSDRDGDFDIFVMKPNGTGLVQLTNIDGEDAAPVWKR